MLYAELLERASIASAGTQRVEICPGADLATPPRQLPNLPHRQIAAVPAAPNIRKLVNFSVL